MSDKTIGVLEDLVDALRENSELLRGMTSKAKANLPADVKGKAADKGDDDGEDKPKRTRASSTKAKVPTAKELSTATTAFLEVTDEDEYESRKAIVKKIVAKFDAAKMSEIEEADRTEAMALLQVAIEGGNPFKRKRDEDDDVA